MGLYSHVDSWKHNFAASEHEPIREFSIDVSGYYYRLPEIWDLVGKVSYCFITKTS